MLICSYECPADISRTAAPSIRRFSENSAGVSAFAAQANVKSSFLGERIPNPNWKMYVDAKWPPDPLLKLVGAPTPELIVLPRNRAAAAAWSLKTVYDLAAKRRIGLRFNCKNLTSKCASLRFTIDNHRGCLPAGTEGRPPASARSRRPRRTLLGF